jgi:hypothetical protein
MKCPAFAPPEERLQAEKPVPPLVPFVQPPLYAELVPLSVSVCPHPLPIIPKKKTQQNSARRALNDFVFIALTGLVSVKITLRKYYPNFWCYFFYTAENEGVVEIVHCGNQTTPPV